MTETDITSHAFRPTLGDHLRFLIVSYYRNLVRWPRGAMYAALTVGLPLAGNFQDLIQHRFSGICLQIVLLAGLFTLLLPALSVVLVWWSFKRNASLSCERFARLTDRSFVVEGSGLFSELTWNNFYRAERRNRHIFLYLSASQAHLIPVSAFDTPELADAFLRRARELIAQSSHAQAAVFDTPVTPSPTEPEFQSQPYHRTFANHLRLYLTRQYLWSGLAVAVSVIPVVVIWLKGWVPTAERGDRGLWTSLVTIVILTCLAFIMPPVSLSIMWWMSRRHPSSKGSRVAALIGDRLVIHGPSFHSEVKLGDFRWVRWTPELMKFSIRPGIAIGVPVSAFETPAQARAFFDQAFARWQAARPAKSGGGAVAPSARQGMP